MVLPAPMGDGPRVVGWRIRCPVCSRIVASVRAEKDPTEGQLVYVRRLLRRHLAEHPPATELPEPLTFTPVQAAPGQVLKRPRKPSTPRLATWGDLASRLARASAGARVKPAPAHRD